MGEEEDDGGRAIPLDFLFLKVLKKNVELTRINERSNLGFFIFSHHDIFT